MARYEKAATLVADRFRKELREAGIKHMVSCRAKHPQDLAGKLRSKSREKPEIYNWEALREELGTVVTDLAGCRVVVYTPADELIVGSIVPKVFAQPPRTDAGPERRRKVDSAYWATHALVFAYASEQAADPTVLGAVCEVQIVTVAAHLFNEIEHDISYKERDPGLTADDDERQLLHEIRGVARVADRLVEGLITYRARRRSDAQHRIESAEDLRFALWVNAGRPVKGTELGRLLAILEQCLEVVTPATMRQLGAVNDLIERGRTLVGSSGDKAFDEVDLYAVGLLEQFGPEIKAVSKAWRGPKTSMRRAIEAATATEQRSGV
jgi:ppGpp synthetase/RelA/SpoT-type nucleotidyltranferase